MVPVAHEQANDQRRNLLADRYRFDVGQLLASESDRLPDKLRPAEKVSGERKDAARVR
ncbi:MAG TPA: hypothetical protein VH374_00060 [Polyangia bacterium]|jgi:hypothetical protein|nr:hypothetical protein [Polyangia bacterium]